MLAIVGMSRPTHSACRRKTALGHHKGAGFRVQGRPFQASVHPTYMLLLCDTVITVAFAVQLHSDNVSHRLQRNLGQRALLVAAYQCCTYLVIQHQYSEELYVSHIHRT